jgi:hypothetical protein
MKLTECAHYGVLRGSIVNCRLNNSGRAPVYKYKGAAEWLEMTVDS